MCKILVDGARRRRTHWASAEQAAAQLRSKPPYSAWHADCFIAYLECGLKPVLWPSWPSWQASMRPVRTS
ncbi:hypothetical protein HaLaN_31877, partial [Haematococcus lacustris]